MIKSIRHTGIVVRDLKESERFYCSLGFVKVSGSLEQGSYIDTLVGLKKVKLEWVKLKAPDGYILELLQYHSHQEYKHLIKQKSNQLGCSHLAFEVDNIDIVCDLIKTLGGGIVNNPALNDNKDAKVVYCHDNEGNLMEMVEIL